MGNVCFKSQPPQSPVRTAGYDRSRFGVHAGESNGAGQSPTAFLRDRYATLMASHAQAFPPEGSASVPPLDPQIAGQLGRADQAEAQRPPIKEGPSAPAGSGDVSYEARATLSFAQTAAAHEEAPTQRVGPADYETLERPLNSWQRYQSGFAPGSNREGETEALSRPIDARTTPGLTEALPGATTAFLGPEVLGEVDELTGNQPDVAGTSSGKADQGVTGRDELMFALDQESPRFDDAVRGMHEKGPNIFRAGGDRGMTVLHDMALRGKNHAVQLILQLDPGAAGECFNDLGQTALHCAAATDQLTVVKTLVQHDPSLANSMDKKCQKPLDFAVMQGNSKVSDYLAGLTESVVRQE